MSASHPLSPSPKRNGARPKLLLDRVAIITGAANGIGLAMAHMFAEAGARVVVADIDCAAGTKTVYELGEKGYNAHFEFVDIASPGDIQAMFQNVAKKWGRVDVLVNNAGIGLNRPFLDTTLEEWNTTLSVILTGTFSCSQAAARIMVQQQQGVIVNIASISGQRGAQGRTAYGVAKAGVIQLTKVMAVELADCGIRVNAIAPGPVDTIQSRATHTPATRKSYLERIPLHRYGETQEIASAALFLASDESRFIQGHVLNVDGGFYTAGLMFDPAETSIDADSNCCQARPSNGTERPSRLRTPT